MWFSTKAKPYPYASRNAGHLDIVHCPLQVMVDIFGQLKPKEQARLQAVLAGQAQ